MAAVMDSGNWMLPHCQHFAGKHVGEQSDVWEAECAAIISTLLFVGPGLPDGWKICAPVNSVTTQQAARVVVKYMEAHPEKLHLNYKVIAMSALDATWPCK